jgi:hypothetical protein
MVDGSIQNKGLFFNVYAFNLEEVIILKFTLENLFAPKNIIKFSLHNHNKRYSLYI